MTNRPLPPEIYRRRRIAALVLIIVAILVIAGIVRWAASGSGDDTAVDAAGNQAAESSETVTVSRTDGVEETSAPANAPSAEPYATTEAVPETVDKDTCSLEDLRISVVASQPNYTDTNPSFSMTMANPTRADCVIDLSRETLRFEVYDMTNFARTWSDVDCHESEGTGTVTVKPGADVVYSVNWSRLGSAPGTCGASDRREAAPGSYLVYGLVGDRHSDPFTFNMRG